jgi:hypothetical protein
MAILDRWLPEFNVNEVHAAVLADAPERAIVRALALPAAPDGIVRTLFRLRGLRGSSLPIERFLCKVLRFEVVDPDADIGRGRGRCAPPPPRYLVRG